MSLFTLSNGFKHLYISPLKHNSSPSLHYCMYSMYTTPVSLSLFPKLRHLSTKNVSETLMVWPVLIL